MLRIGDKNVLFGGKAAALINFTIGSTSYQAEEGMTWGEWVDSEYNTPDPDSIIFFQNAGRIMKVTMSGVVITNIKIVDKYTAITPDEIIISGYDYFTSSTSECLWECYDVNGDYVSHNCFFIYGYEEFDNGEFNDPYYEMAYKDIIDNNSIDGYQVYNLYYPDVNDNSILICSNTGLDANSFVGIRMYFNEIWEEIQSEIDDNGIITINNVMRAVPIAILYQE